MKDDSFVVEAFVKNVGKNYRNHKWIKKKFQFLCCTQTYEKRRKKLVEEIFKVELFDGKHETAEKEFFREIEDRRDSGS